MKKFLHATFVAGLMLSFMPASGALSQSTIKVGALYPFSGPLALLGDESFRGLELAIEERNAAGGLHGKPLQLVRGDALDPNQAVGEARRLTSVDKVSAIFGTYSSSLSVAATQVAELAGVPYFELGAVAEQITERKFKNVYRANPTAKLLAEKTVDAVVDVAAPALNIDYKALKVAIIHEDSLYGQTVAGYQIARAKERGINLIETLPYSAKSVDLTPVILRLKSAGADVVLQTSYQNDTVLFFRQMKEQGLKPKAVVGSGGGYSLRDTIAAIGTENMEGALTVEFTQYRTNTIATPGLEDFFKKYEAKYGMAPRSGYSLLNYAGAKVFLGAMASAKDLSSASVREAVMKVDIPFGTTATGYGAKFGEDGQNERVTLFLYQWQDGELVTVYPPEAAVAKVKVGVGAAK